MEAKEAQSAFDELRQKGYDDEQILAALAKMFEDDQITKDQLVGFAEALGAEVNPDFIKLSDDEAKKSLWEEDPKEAKEGMTEGQVEDSETDPDGKPAPQDTLSKSDDEDDEDKGTDEESKESADDKKKAFDLMGL